MAKPKKKKKRKPGHGAGAPALDPEAARQAALRELDARLAELRADPDEPGPVWGAAHKLLLKAKADPGDAARLIASRDPDSLARMIQSLRGDGPDDDALETATDAPPHADIPPEILKRAMRAFRKRVKLIRLDHESRLSVSPMTSGKKADFDAIMAPQEFPAEVWEALADAGELRRAGRGFYMLPDGG